MQYLQISDQISKMFWLKNKFKNIKQTNYVKVHAYTYKKNNISLCNRIFYNILTLQAI